MKIEKEVMYILSDEYLNSVLSSGKWCYHGSNIIHYFEDNEFEIEYGNSRDKRYILKRYIKEQINKIIKDLKDENPTMLYRSINAKEKPDYLNFFGHFWSSKENTAPCVRNDDNSDEYLLTINFDSDMVDWKQTLSSRMDYVYGDREKEYYLKHKNIKLKNIHKI